MKKRSPGGNQSITSGGRDDCSLGWVGSASLTADSTIVESWVFQRDRDGVVLQGKDCVGRGCGDFPATLASLIFENALYYYRK